MSDELTRDPGPLGEIAELERKVAGLRLARAQMIAEREEHGRNAIRSATVLGGLAQIQRELGILASERAKARDATIAERDAATTELAHLGRAGETAERNARALERRLSEARESVSRLTREGSIAERATDDASAAAANAIAQYDETARAEADVTLKYEAALAETAIAQGRDAQFTDIEETLDREQMLAETRLREARVLAETRQVETDLQRILELEGRLSVERADLERRLRAMRSNAEVPLQKVAMSPPAVTRTLRNQSVEANRLSLAARLARDLAIPGANA